MASLLDTATKKRYDEQFAAIRQLAAAAPPKERYKLSIEDVKVGGLFKFGGKSYLVRGINTYEREGFRWPELVLYCLQDGQTSYLEWEKGDQVSVFVSLEKLSFAQVDIQGKEQLWKISEDEEGSAHYRGQPYSYHEDSAVTFFRDSKEEGTPFHQYQFASDDEETFISVEEWGDEDEGYEHNIILSGKLNAAAIEVITAGEDSGDGNG